MKSFGVWNLALMGEIDPGAAENISHFGIKYGRADIKLGVNTIFLNKEIPVMVRTHLKKGILFQCGQSSSLHPPILPNIERQLEEIKILVLFPFCSLVAIGIDVVLFNERLEIGPARCV